MNYLIKSLVALLLSISPFFVYAECSCEHHGPPSFGQKCEEGLSASGFPYYYDVPAEAGYNSGFSGSVSGTLHLTIFVESSGKVTCGGGSPDGFTVSCPTQTVRGDHACCSCEFDVTATYTQASRSSIESGLDDSERDYETRYGERSKFPDITAHASSSGHIGGHGNANALLSRGPDTQVIVNPDN
ncbi:hypothetical protein [Dongshaea marina]|uniref:hypothetical protein n=1 Tax=Dongshaea marina TaxID=2047966 RepID=UPI00131F20F4|nr:hypothetical protein [Dongshaea marina]